MEEIKRYSREDINSMKKQFLLQDRRFIDMLDHKAVVEDLTRKFESQREQTHKNFQYVDQKNHEINKLDHDIETMQNKIDELTDYLELAVGQSDQCPICKRWDFRELGHVSTCFMRTLPNGNIQSAKGIK